jgi:hypothetical protein
MTSTSTISARPPLIINGQQVPMMPIGEFMADRTDRASSFISNFGDWQLPPDAAEAFGSPVVHLEWFHNTGELTAFGQIPHLGHGDIEISGAQAAIDTVAPLFGGAGGRIVHTDGAVHQWFPAMVVGPETLVAVLETISSGPQARATVGLAPGASSR